MSSENPALREGESKTYSSGTSPPTSPPTLRFIHYNDVYHVEPGSRNPVGGLPRFKSLCETYTAIPDQPSEIITFFSGDAFNPSLESSVTKGAHMVPALNSLHTTVACLGNHDLDFGVEQFEHLAAKCTFPWLCANVLDSEGVPLGHCKRTAMLESSNGVKIGVVGVVEREWLDTINSLPPGLQYFSAGATVRELAGELRRNGAEIVVVVSHQRQPNDEKLARGLEPGVVDVILGGHDHFYAHVVINGTHVLRSGSDFKQLSYLELRRKGEGKKGWDVDVWRRDVVASIPEEPEAVKMVEKITASLKAKLEKPIGYTVAPLDARFTTVRLKESNLGNFVADLMRFHYDADCCIMAAGTIRGDQIYPPGMLLVKDLLACFPFEDPCVVVGVSGKNIVEALENGVCKYPALEGRFPQVSNIEFSFDPNKEPGQRCSSVLIGGKPVDVDREYKLVTRDYMARGKDGFTSLLLKEKGGPARSIVSDENGMLLSMLLRQYFMSLRVFGKWKNRAEHLGQHWRKIQSSLHEVQPVRDAVQKEAELKGNNKTASNEAGSQPNGNGDGSESLNGTALAQRPTKDRTPPPDGYLSDSSDDDDMEAAPQKAVPERQLMLMRKVMRKWWRLTGLPGHPNICATKGEEFGVNWTRGICPRTEGRIKILGTAA